MIYRRKGGLIWYDGDLENISLSGVLLHGEKAIPLGDHVEISFRLPTVPGGTQEGDIFFWARIIRTEQRSNPGAHLALAARVLRYRSEPKPAPDVRKIVGEVRGPVKSR